MLKCTHDSGTVIIGNNKSKIDKNLIKKNYIISKKKNSTIAIKMAYKNVKPRIIAEKLMHDEKRIH